jgi:hypothetical protein
LRLLLLAAAAALAASAALAQQPSVPDRSPAPARAYLGFDRNDYPGDAALPELRKHFAFTGYWLTNPPGATHNSWLGTRDRLRGAGFGFLIVANGRLDEEINRAAKRGKSPASFGRADAADAIAAAQREGFPAAAILFLDQEEGGRLLPEQAAYLFAWTETVARSAYLPGVYASGQPSDDGPGPNGKPIFITTIQDIRAHVAANHLHPVAFWVTRDACPPAPGCVVSANPPAPDASGTLDAAAWQFAQSPRRPSFTRACAHTYAADGNCDTPAPARLFVDLSTAPSPDPSHGR